MTDTDTSGRAGPWPQNAYAEPMAQLPARASRARPFCHWRAGSARRGIRRPAWSVPPARRPGSTTWPPPRTRSQWYRWTSQTLTGASSRWGDVVAGSAASTYWSTTPGEPRSARSAHRVTVSGPTARPDRSGAGHPGGFSSGLLQLDHAAAGDLHGLGDARDDL